MMENFAIEKPIRACTCKWHGLSIWNNFKIATRPRDTDRFPIFLKVRKIFSSFIQRPISQMAPNNVNKCHNYCHDTLSFFPCAAPKMENGGIGKGNDETFIGITSLCATKAGICSILSIPKVRWEKWNDARYYLANRWRRRWFRKMTRMRTYTTRTSKKLHRIAVSVPPPPPIISLTMSFSTS